ncbi:MAG: hypothetical protein ACK4IB_08925 [Erythrobacter sp.]
MLTAMADVEQGLSTYNTIILFGMRVVAGCVSLFSVVALTSQFLFGNRFLDRDLGVSEVLIMIAMNAFAWTVVAIFPRWARFVESIVRR